jgi:hypothetical protein
MKRIFKLIFAAATMLGAVIQSQAASFSTGTISGMPVSLAQSATSNVLAVLDTRKAENLAVVFAYLPGGTTTQNVTITFEFSIDNSYWAVAPTVPWVFASPGTTNETVIATNIATTGYGYVRVKSIANAGSGSTLVPVSTKYSLKLLNGN